MLPLFETTIATVCSLLKPLPCMCLHMVTLPSLTLQLHTTTYKYCYAHNWWAYAYPHTWINKSLSPLSLKSHSQEFFLFSNAAFTTNLSVWWNALINHKVVLQYEIVFDSARLCLTEHGHLLNLKEIGILKVLVYKFVQILYIIMCNARMQISYVKAMYMHTKWAEICTNYSV